MNTDVYKQLHFVVVLAAAAVETDAGDDDARPVDAEGDGVRTAVTRVPVRTLTRTTEPVRGEQHRLAGRLTLHLGTSGGTKVTG